VHELSIAISLVEIAEEEARRRGVRVTGVHLRLGALSGVVKEALVSSYEMASYETPLQGSRLIVEEVPVVVYCAECGEERRLDSVQLFRCGICGSPTGDVRQGKEMEVVALEIEE
jgi:hydrogenase nickel incorporation protein HypA/HybF